MSLFPFATTNGNAGLFADPTAYGLVQGQDYSDPSTNFRLRGGYVATDETLPMWGGVAVYQLVPGAAGKPLTGYGSPVGRATTVTGGSKNIAGWSVFQANYAWVNEPGSTAPQGGPGQSCNFYPLGSLARIVVACDPVLVDLAGEQTNAQVSWDFVNQMLIPYTGAVTVSSGTYNSTSGLVTLTLATAIDISPGDSVTVSGATGTGSYADIDGTYNAGVGTTGTTVTYTIATGLTLTITGGSLTTGAALPSTVNVLDVQGSNCVTIAYDSVTGATNYSFSGACAVIQI